MATLTLDYDILWTIFILNASQGEYRLRTTLASSHVCQEWRNIILGSSKLWGRLVTITSSGKEECIEEIIRRSGSSPLWVEALLDSAIDQLTAVLNGYWERIELLHIRGSDILLAKHEEDFSKFFARPAPFLRSFSLINTNHTGLLFRNQEHLFASDAPLLRSLVTNVIVLPDQFALFAHLRELSWRLQGTIPEMLDCLRHMPNIEYMTMRKTRMEEANTLETLPHISLPHLTHLRMSCTSLDAFIALFDHITVSSTGCMGKIYIYIWTQDEALNSRLLRLGRPISKFVENHVKLQKYSHTLTLRFWNNKLRFKLDASSEIIFHWKVLNKENAPPPGSLSLLFDAFKTVDLSCITRLEFVHRPATSYFGVFLPFLSSSLSSVTTLKTNPSFFRSLYIQYMQDYGCDFVPFDHLVYDSPFPNLQNLEISHCIHSAEIFHDHVGRQFNGHFLLHFLRTQKALGRGPSVLSMGVSVLEGTNFGSLYLRELLEEVDGLEVTWYAVELS